MNYSVAEDRLLADVSRRKIFDVAQAALGRLLSDVGFRLGDYHAPLVQRAVVQRMLKVGVNRVDDYVAHLQRDSTEAFQLGCQLQRPRQPWFDCLKGRQVLPQTLAMLSHGDRALQIWLPGCGDGTEAFLLAVVAAQRLGLGDDPNFTIYATDVDSEALASARRGLLTPTATALIANYGGQEHLVQRAAGAQIAPALLQRLVFLNADFTAPAPLFDLDLICCRGLLANFGLATQRQLLRQMHAALHAGGLLLVGQDDQLSGHEDLFDCDLQLKTLYRRSVGTRLLSKQLPVTAAHDGPAVDAYRSVIQRADDAALFLDRSLDIRDVNPAASMLTAAPRDRPAAALLGENLVNLFVEADRSRVHDAAYALGAGGRTVLAVTLLNGRAMQMRITHLGVPGPLNYYAEFNVESTAAVQEPPARDRFVDAALGLLDEAVVVVDSLGCVIEFGGSAERLTGWTRAETLAQPCTRVLRMRHSDGAAVDVADLVIGKANPAPLQLVNKNGHGVEVGVAVHRLEVGSVLILRDLSETKLLRDEIEYRNMHDPLTGLLNRDAFEVRCRAALDDAHRRGVSALLCYVDVDQFRVINDTLGHIAGDELLHALAGVLRAALREHDALARLGGDEFGVLLTMTRGRIGRDRVEALMDAVREFRFLWDGVSYSVTASIGVATIDANSENVTRAMSLADAACFLAKDTGRDRARFAGDDDELSRRHIQMSLVGKIGQALDEQRFVLHYEDVVDLLAPERIVYRELLIRMRDDDGQLLTPSGFIQAAERYYLMGAVDRWVLRQTFEGVARLPKDSVIYALNLSGQSLGDEKFLDAVLAELDRSGVDPGRICFEITETAAVSRLSEAVRFINCVSDFGCRFALDDFGAGMSSFHYLKNFRVNFLKIDGSFVRTMLGNRSDRRMVESINRIGHEMGLRTIAEHIETPDLLAPLREIGVDWGQGRSISRSLPFEGLLLPQRLE